MKITKKKHFYKVEHKGQVRYCTEDKIAKVKKELLALNGKLPKEVYL